MATLLDVWYSTWLPLAGAALGLAITISALVYMLGAALVNDKMKSWAKMELVEVFYSAVIIALIAPIPSLGAFMLVDSAIQAGLFPNGATPSVYVPEQGITLPLCGGGGNADAIAAPDTSIYHDVPACHMRLGIWYLHTIFKEAQDLAYKDYLTYIYTATAADFTINFEFITQATGFFSITPWRGFFTTGNTIKAMVFDYLVKLMILTKFQEVMLSFVARALFPALFVTGAVLRTFTFSRRLGGLLLATGLALYYVFPAFYSLGGLVVYDLKQGLLKDPGFQSLCGGLGLGTVACTQDPPITNFLYVAGEIPMPGGNLDTKDAQQKYNALQSQTMEQRLGASESSTGGLKALDSQNGQPGADFAKSVPLADRQKAMADARAKTDSWFKQVSSLSKLDSGVFVAYSPGGPVDALARIAFFSVFFALFGILATIASIRSISMTLGGDIEIAGLTHLI
jgi:hypothetical protein